MEYKEVNDKLKNIKLLAMDVDGTLTDGAMYYSADGESLKTLFNNRRNGRYTAKT